jgi:hypothetical protein
MAEYAFNFDKAQKGQIVDSSIHRIDSYPCGDDNLDFGVGAYVDNGVLKKYTSGAVLGTFIQGITVFSQTCIKGNYKKGDAVSLLSYGRIWVIASADVIANTTAWVNDSGHFVNQTDGTVSFAGLYLTSASNGELVALDFSYESVNS